MATIPELEKDFKRLAKGNALAQAYVLHGPAVAGQFTFAKALANFLETKKWQEPEAVLLDAKFIDGTTQKLGVEVAREFSEFLYRQPVASPKRTLVINSAAEFTDQAQNAILKIVEEPPSHALIMLTMRDVNSLLPALRSRLQAIYVSGNNLQVGSNLQFTMSPQETRARELVEKFFMAGASERSKLVKGLVDEDTEIRDELRKKPTMVHEQFIVDLFVNELILELAKKPEQNVLALKELLKRQTAMGDYSTSRKLQLEAALQYLK